MAGSCIANSVLLSNDVWATGRHIQIDGRPNRAVSFLSLRSVYLLACRLGNTG